MKSGIFLLLLLFKIGAAYSQVQGCTDPFASNYNAAATSNNGSCVYNTTTYTPPVKVDPVTDSLIETSGLQMAGGALWSFNDKDGTPTIYRIDTASNALLQRVILSGATNEDWEDIGFDGTHLYIGDFGNNLTGARRNLVIYKFPIDSIADYHTSPVVIIPSHLIERIQFRYSNQSATPVDTTANSTRFDCEAMLVDNGQIHLFSKNWIDLTSTHYVINSTAAGSYVANAVETLATNYLVTAADKIPGQNTIVLLGYQNTGLGNHFMHVLSDYPGVRFFDGNKRRIDLPDATVMGQAEGICFSRGQLGYISNEKFVRSAGPFTITVTQKLRGFDLTGLTGNHFTQYIFEGNGNWSDTSNWKYQLRPPNYMVPGNEILINPAAGQCVLDISYHLPAGAKLIIAAGKNLLIAGSLIIQ